MDHLKDKAYEIAKEFINEYPQFEENASELFTIMCDEMNAGESPDNEFELFQNALNDLKEEDGN